MSREARHAPIPRRPSPDPASTEPTDGSAPTADGAGGAASGRSDGPGFFERPSRMNWSHRSDVSTHGADATGQDQLPGRPGVQQSREDRTSRGGAVGQGEQGAGDRNAGRSTPTEHITRPRYPSFRPPQPTPTTPPLPPPPASARFPDTPPPPATPPTDPPPGREPGRP
ncbi:hypothetical protein ABZ372_53030, partial [Streptomyces sp. NPDC005921]